MNILHRVTIAMGLILLSAALLFGSASTVSAASITTPRSGDTIINTNAQFTGQATANAIVKVVLTDADTSRSNIAHQPGGKVEASVTSDKDGNWVYVPHETLVPGQFTIQVTYSDGSGNEITSAAVAFSVVDSRGNSTVPSFGVKVIVALVIFAVLIVVLLLLRLLARKRQWPKRNFINIGKAPKESIEEIAEVEKEIEEVTQGLEVIERGVDEMRQSLHDLEEIVEKETAETKKKDKKHK